jgi:hypothetical protein
MPDVAGKKRSVTQRVARALEAAHRRDVEVTLDHLITFKSADKTISETQAVIAGSANSLCDSQLIFDHPSRKVVIEDGAAPSTIERLLGRVGNSGRLINISRYYDMLWSADCALDWVKSQSEEGRDPAAATRQRSSAYERPNLVVSGTAELGSAAGSREAELAEWIKGDSSAPNRYEGNIVFISGSAGMGKTEYTRWLLRYGYNLKHAGAEAPSFDRPMPLVVRIPLRDVDYLSIGGLRRYLADHAGVDDISEGLLHHLIIERRIVLLLDGLDEIDPIRNDIEEGFARLEETAMAGGRILVTSRLSSTSSLSPLQHVRRMMESENPIHAVALELRPFDRAQSIDLLTRNGSSVENATDIVDQLPAELVGVPLFLMWSQEIDVRQLGGGGAQGFLDLVSAVCTREAESRRIANPPEKQLKALRELALDLRNECVAQSFLEAYLDAPDHQFVTGPHALLTVDAEGNVRFRHEAFEAILLAEALSIEWHAEQDKTDTQHRDWLRHRLVGSELNPLTLEYLCEMVSPERVARAWRCAALNPDRQLPGLRWHLLNVALIAVNKSTASGTAHAAAGAGHRERQRARASELALYLPDRDLSDMKLRSLALSQFAWQGWSLRNLAGDGAEFHHCDFAGAQVDDTLNTARLIEPRGVTEVHAGAGLAGD